MKVFQVRGYPRNYYFVKTFSELAKIMRWAEKNRVGVLHECAGRHGHGFSIGENFEWFALKWL